MVKSRGLIDVVSIIPQKQRFLSWLLLKRTEVSLMASPEENWVISQAIAFPRSDHRSRAFHTAAGGLVTKQSAPSTQISAALVTEIKRLHMLS